MYALVPPPILGATSNTTRSSSGVTIAWSVNGPMTPGGTILLAASRNL